MSDAVYRHPASAACAIVAGGALTLLLASLPAGAQTATAPAATAGDTLSEVIVTALRREDRAKDVPVSLDVESSAELERAGISNMRDLAEAVPGLNYAGQGPFSEPSLRGVYTTFTQPGSGSPIGIYLDGVYQSNQGGNFFELPDVDRVEVMKGPQGTLFGRNATGGAIAIHTLDPTFTPSGKISLSDGVYSGDGGVHTANEVSVNGRLSGPLFGDVLAGSITGFYKKNDGYFTNIVTGKGAGEVESYVLRGKLLYKPTDTQRWTLAVSHSDLTDHASNSMRVLNDLSAGVFYEGAVWAPANKPWDVASPLHNGVSTVKTKTDAVSLRGEFDIGQVGTLTSLTGYTKVDMKLWQPVDGTLSPGCMAIYVCLDPYVVFYGPTKTFSQEFIFSSQKVNNISWVAGLSFYHDDTTYGSSVAPTLSADGTFDLSDRGIFWVDSTLKTKAYAAFGEVTFGVTDKLSFITGLRYSWEQQTGAGSTYSAPFVDLGGSPKWSAWTPRLSAIYALTPATNVYATYSEGFKAGVIETVSASGQVANPEKLKSYEVGIKTAQARFSASAAAFYYDYSDMQVQFFDGTITTIGNAAKSKIYGLDLDGRFLLGHGLELRAGGSWLPTAKYVKYENAQGNALPMTATGFTPVLIDASGERLQRTPKFTGTLSLAYSTPVAWGLLEASGSWHYSTESTWEITERLKTDAYSTLNAQVSLKPGDKGFKYTLWGRNLTNAAYLLGTTVSGEADTGNYAAPRQVGFTVDYAF